MAGNDPAYWRSLYRPPPKSSDTGEALAKATVHLGDDDLETEIKRLRPSDSKPAEIDEDQLQEMVERLIAQRLAGLDINALAAMAASGARGGGHAPAAAPVRRHPAHQMPAHPMPAPPPPPVAMETIDLADELFEPHANASSNPPVFDEPPPPPPPMDDFPAPPPAPEGYSPFEGVDDSAVDDTEVDPNSPLTAARGLSAPSLAQPQPPAAPRMPPAATPPRPPPAESRPTTAPAGRMNPAARAAARRPSSSPATSEPTGPSAPVRMNPAARAAARRPATSTTPSARRPDPPSGRDPTVRGAAPPSAGGGGSGIENLLDRTASLPGGQASLLSGNSLSQEAIMVLVMVDGMTSLRGLRTLAPHVSDAQFASIVKEAVAAKVLALE